MRRVEGGATPQLSEQLFEMGPNLINVRSLGIIIFEPGKQSKIFEAEHHDEMKRRID